MGTMIYLIYFLNSGHPGLQKTLAKMLRGNGDARTTFLSFPVYDSIYHMGIWEGHWDEERVMMPVFWIITFSLASYGLKPGWG